MSVPRIKIRATREGAMLTSRQAVALGVERGWTAKETAYETNWSIDAIQAAASRMRVSLSYIGVGRKPTYPNVLPKKAKGCR